MFIDKTRRKPANKIINFLNLFLLPLDTPLVLWLGLLVAEENINIKKCIRILIERHILLLGTSVEKAETE